MTDTTGDFILTQRDRAGRITLNRPQQRHALTIEMLIGIREALQTWQSDPAVDVVLLTANGEDGFCGGSDLGALCKGPTPDAHAARLFWSHGARLAATMARFPKPLVAIVDGLAVGSGVGLIAHATYRVVSQRARLALPETAIGLVPDLGLTWLLARSAGAAGSYMALCGQPLDAGAAIQMGLADGMIHSDALNELCDRLTSPFGGQIERILNGFVADAGPGNLVDDLPLISTAFGEPSIEQIIRALETLGERGQQIAATLASRSPLALKLTLSLMQKVKGAKTIEEALLQEHRVLNRLFEFGEIQEGVRARLIDTDRAPAWAFAELADVDQMLLASFFSPMLPGEDLRFAETLA
jgi:enoyl-CoA hydratase